MSFMQDRNVHAAQSNGYSDSVSVDELLLSLTEIMNNDRSRIWTSVELHKRYIELSNEDSDATNTLSRRELIPKLQNYFGDVIVKIDISGCASLICFKSHLPVCIRLEKVDDTEEKAMIGKLTDIITTECRALPKTRDYDVSQFRKSKTIENTSPTLLSLISSLVSNGNTTKASITLAQSIQGHVTKSYNQTTLGLALKLHHRFGSNELVSLLHESGITVTYDEVLRFRKSAAIYTGSQPYTLRGLKRNGGELVSWIDKYDLNISHQMVVEKPMLWW